jgi:hypothetical protein
MRKMAFLDSISKFSDKTDLLNKLAAFRKFVILDRAKLSKFKKDYCEECGFVAIHRSQLDIDHIDGNHLNNDMANLQTLCANCHRLKTQDNRDWENKKAPR